MRYHEPDGRPADPEHDEATGGDDILEFRLGVTALPERLDRVLAGLMPEHSRSRLQGWIEAGHVLLNGKSVRIRQLAGPGDLIQVRPQLPPEDLAFTPQDIAFHVVHDSPDWIVVDKPAGLVTHPGAGNWSGTLLNGLLHRYPELARLPRAGIVHRLDKDTSGLMVVARTETAQTHLVRQLQARSVHREYLAMLHGHLTGEGRVERAIGRDPAVPVRMSVDRPIAPRPALTRFQAQRHGAWQEHAVTLAACRLETGRTHQIRVHMASLQHPLLGDSLYGGRCIAGAQRQMLHAWKLCFDDPASGKEAAFTSDPPADFQTVREAITWL